jgi:Trypsin
VRVGEHTIDKPNDCLKNESKPECFVQDIPIDKIIVHEQYSPQINDIALIRLKENFIRRKNARTVCLPVFDYQNQLKENQKFSLAGWGVTDGRNIQSKILQKTFLDLTNLDECKSIFRSFVEKYSKMYPQLKDKVKITNDNICATGVNESDA